MESGEGENRIKVDHSRFELGVPDIEDVMDILVVDPVFPVAFLEGEGEPLEIEVEMKEGDSLESVSVLLEADSGGDLEVITGDVRGDKSYFSSDIFSGLSPGEYTGEISIRTKWGHALSEKFSFSVIDIEREEE